MRKVEVDRKFDEIVEFSGVEKFIDTPVKRYSSGMRVRLAFSVAAHLEPEVLLVDEVLAVGDHAFQQKCLGKMKQVSREYSRTVLFVSHNMTAISNICPRALLFEAGQLVTDGDAEETITQYLASFGTRETAFVDLRDWPDHYGRGEFARILSIGLFDKAGQPSDLISMGQGLIIKLHIQFYRPQREPEIGIVVSTLTGERVCRFVSLWEGFTKPVQEGEYVYEIQVPQITLVPGAYTLTPWVKQRGLGSDDYVESPLRFQVVESDVTGHAPFFQTYCRPGEFYAPSEWNIERV
jgi:lipopolysaccharide transport system ATP-binding protein